MYKVGSIVEGHDGSQIRIEDIQLNSQFECIVVFKYVYQPEYTGHPTKNHVQPLRAFQTYLTKEGFIE